MTTYLESQIEERLRCLVRERLGMAVKMRPIPAGLPDRQILLPGGISTWVELKKPGERPTRLQKYWHRRLELLGQDILVLDSMRAVEEYIEDYVEEMKR